jgi:heme exporter protein B
VNALLAVLWKDLLTEWRSRDRAIAMLLFSMLMVVIFHFSLPGGATNATRAYAPGLLWVAYVFAALLGLGRSFAIELENDAIEGLARAPVDRGWVLLGKTIANLVILAFVQAVTACVFALVFEMDLTPVALELAGVIALGSLGLCSVGTFFAAVAVRTRLREVMLPLLALPFYTPVLVAATRATNQLFETGAVSFEPIQFLIVIDGIYLIASFILSDFVLDE